MHSPSNTTI